MRYTTVSGEFGHDDTFDTAVRNQCGNQSGYDSDADAYANYCFGPIHNALSCCYCYDKAYPTFVFEEARKSTYDDVTKAHWESHIPLLNLTNSSDEIININNYVNLNDFSRKSYYFCMKPRAHSIPTDEINITSLHEALGDNKLVLATGKWGYNETFKNDVLDSCDAIKGKSLFDNVHCHYNDNEPSFLPANDTRFERHMQYLYNQTDDSSRGGGYWFHKVVVMRYYMSIYNDNDYILWSDHDYVNRLEPLGLYKMVDTMLDRNADIILELLAGIEQDWTKEDILHAFNASREVRETYQVWAGFKLVRNTPKMREFYDALIECHANYHMLSDEPSTLPNHQDYSENRHDQSILSLFYKTFLSNQTVIGPPVQTYFYLHRFTFQLKEETNVYCPF